LVLGVAFRADVALIAVFFPANSVPDPLLVDAFFEEAVFRFAPAAVVVVFEDPRCLAAAFFEVSGVLSARAMAPSQGSETKFEGASDAWPNGKASRTTP
jgi:hypothetical protein